MRSVTATRYEPDTWVRLLAAREEYVSDLAPAYDDVLDAVSARVAGSGSLGKDDIGALLFWKRLRADTRWARALHAIPDEQVRSVTSEAIAAVNDKSLDLPGAAHKGRSLLSTLPGFRSGDALASAILLSGCPGRMAVYDRRAQTGITRLGLKLTPARGRYGRYLSLINDLLQHRPVAAQEWIPRYVDTALFRLGGK